LKRIEDLLGRSVVKATYRGGHSSFELGHFFEVLCADGTFFYVSSDIKRFEQSEEKWEKQPDGSYRSLIDTRYSIAK
jgi:hypothetical protein